VRTLVYGTGAVGGYFGARLVEGGADVTFLARGRQLAALSATGLTLVSVEGDYFARVRTVARLADAPPPDLVLLCVKAHATPAAAKALAEGVPKEAVVISLQNGVENPDILIDALGATRVIAATVFIGARVAAPGIIQHTAAGIIRAGRYPEGTAPHVTRVIEFLQAHGVKAKETRTIRRDLWHKLLWNAGFNGPSALTCATVGAMTDRPGIRWLIGGLVAEAGAVARKAGVDLPDDAEAKTVAQVDGLADFKTSMLQDVEAGRPVEREAFYGVLVREGERLGVETPLARMVNDALALRFDGP
jgi:2-dehydropantoate 2-reductase